MALLPTLRRFVAEDYSSVSTITRFVEKFFNPLNQFLNSVYSALANNITLNANTLGQVVGPVKVVSDSTGIAATSFNWNFTQTNPVGLVVLNCYDSTFLPAYSPLVKWSYKAGVVTVGLQFVSASGGHIIQAPTNTYYVVLWMSGG